MRRGSGIVLAAAGVLCVAATAALTTGSSESKRLEVDALITENTRARGGLERIKAIQSMRLTGTMSVGAARMPAVLEIKRPNKTRLEFTLDGQTGVQAYDGRTAWMVMPFAGKTEPELMPAEDVKDMELQADMDGPLVDYEAKGNRVELVGRETVGGRDTLRLKVTLRNGDVRDVYLDAATYLQLLSVTQRTIGGKPIEVESALDDYRDVGGVKLPHSFETRARGVAPKQLFQVDRIELNVPIDDTRFQMPAGKEPPVGRP